MQQQWGGQLAKAVGAEPSGGGDERWKIAHRCGAKQISKSKVLKTDGFEALLGVEMLPKWTPLWRKAYFQVKTRKTPHAQSTFGSWEVEKAHALAAPSTFGSQKCQKLTGSEQFWTLRCGKSARRCGTKHICKSKALKTTVFDHFWALRCWKSARRCGAKHICKSKAPKTHNFWTLKCPKSARPCGEKHVRKLKVFKTDSLSLRPLLDVKRLKTRTQLQLQLQLHYATSGYNYTTQHQTTTTLHYTTLHRTTPHYTTPTPAPTPTTTTTLQLQVQLQAQLQL